MAIDPRAFLAMIMAGTGGGPAGTMTSSGYGAVPGAVGPTSAPTAFGTPMRGGVRGPAGPEQFFPPRTPGLEGPIRRRMRHPRAHRGMSQIQPAIKAPILPGTAKGLATKEQP